MGPHSSLVCECKSPRMKTEVQISRRRFLQLCLKVSKLGAAGCFCALAHILFSRGHDAVQVANGVQLVLPRLRWFNLTWLRWQHTWLDTNGGRQWCRPVAIELGHGAGSHAKQTELLQRRCRAHCYRWLHLRGWCCRVHCAGRS